MNKIEHEIEVWEQPEHKRSVRVHYLPFSEVFKLANTQSGIVKEVNQIVLAPQICELAGVDFKNCVMNDGLLLEMAPNCDSYVLKEIVHWPNEAA